MPFYVPPGGFAGFSQMTPASQRALSATPRSYSRSGGRKSLGMRRVKTRARVVKKKKRPSSSGGMKFGSPAWQKKYRVGKFAKKRRARRKK